MAGQGHNGMQCSEFDALLSQAIDGTLSGERLMAFEAHGRECKLCGPLLEEAEAGRRWLKALEEVEPPLELVNNILLATTGVPTARDGAGQTWLGRVKEWVEVIVSPIVAVARQPRFAMSFGMAFFTLSVSLSLAGVKVSDIARVDLRPSAIRRTYYETSGRVVKYYENIRFVYEIESRVEQFKRATAPPERPREQPNNNQRKENKNNSSGQPEQRQERNFSQGEGNLIYASLPSGRGTPVGNGATYRRFV